MGFLDGIFNKNENDELELFKKLVTSFKESESFYSDNKEVILSYLEKKLNSDNGNSKLLFTAEEFSFIADGLNKNRVSFEKNVHVIESMYNKIVLNKNSIEQKISFKNLFNASLKDEFCLSKIVFVDYPYIYDLFENKQLFLSLFQYLVSKVNRSDYYINLLAYIKESRQYYVDEVVFFTNIINAVDKYGTYFDEDTIKSLLREDRKKTGIYEVSVNDIEEIEYKISEIKKAVGEFEKTLTAKYDEACSNLVMLEKKYDSTLEQKFVSLNEQINEYNKKASTSMINIEDTVSSFNATVLELKKELEVAYSNLLKGEVVALSSDYEKSVDLIGELIKGSASLGENERKIIRELGKKYLALISAISDKQAKLVKVATPTPLNKYLDSSIPLKDRLKAALANKKSGELYHSSVDKVVKEILNNNAVYLVGPSGSCKTYSVKQVAELLGLPLYDFGFVTDEHETFKSYKDVNGQFVKNVFYQAYKTGGICFFDEIDNSESKALVELNRIIGGNGEYEAYLFPNGELVYPHPNFRVVVAGNTYGEGANEAYSTRERLDFGTVDRFSPVKYYYDEEFERRVLYKYPDAYDFCMAYRAALSLVNDEYYFTTRRIFKLVKNLDSGCYSIDEIIDDFFTKSLRMDVLEKILKNISIDSSNKYYIAFSNAVTSRKSVNTKVRKR